MNYIDKELRKYLDSLKSDFNTSLYEISKNYSDLVSIGDSYKLLQLIIMSNCEIDKEHIKSFESLGLFLYGSTVYGSNSFKEKKNLIINTKNLDIVKNFNKTIEFCTNSNKGIWQNYDSIISNWKLIVLDEVYLLNCKTISIYTSGSSENKCKLIHKSTNELFDSIKEMYDFIEKYVLNIMT